MLGNLRLAVLNLFLLLILFSGVAVADNRVTITYLANQAPYQFINANGHPDGFLINYWQAWADVNDIEIWFTAANDFDEQIRLLNEKKADITAGNISNNSSNSISALTALHHDQINLYGFGESLAHLKNHKDYSPFVLGIAEEALTYDFFEKSENSFRFSHYEDYDALFNALKTRQVVAFAGLSQVVTYQLNQSDTDLDISTQTLSSPVSVENVFFKPFARSDDYELHTKVLSGFANVDYLIRNDIQSRWFGKLGGKDALLISLPNNMAPYSFLTKSGDPAGLLIDFWMLWSTTNAIPIEFVLADYQRSIQFVNDDIADIHGGLSLFDANPQLATFGFYQLPLYKVKLNSISQTDVLEKTLSSVGVSKKIDNESIELATADDITTAINEGKVSAVIGTPELISSFSVNQNISYSSPELLQTSVVAQLSPSMKKRRHIVEDGIEQLNNTELKLIENRWIKNDRFKYFSAMSPVATSQKQQHWLASHDELKIGIVGEQPPYWFFDEQKGYQGIAVDYLSLLTKRLNLAPRLVYFETQQQADEAYKRGDINAIFALKDSEVIDKHTIPLTYFPYALVSGNKSVLTDLSAINDGGLLIAQQSKISEIISKTYPDLKQQPLPQDRALTSIFDRKNANAALVDLPYAVFTMAAATTDDYNITTLAELPMLSLTLQFYQGENEAFIELMQNAASHINQLEHNELRRQWLAVKHLSGIDVRYVIFGVLVTIILMGFILYWNRKLQKEIALRLVAEERIRHLATHDSLTGLPNRVLFLDRLRSCLQLAKREQYKFAVLFIDLDGFKDVNDNYGHQAGDELLRIISNRISQTLRESDTVARFGGDEFTILLPKINDLSGVCFVAEKLLMQRNEPIVIDGNDIEIGFSIGISIYPDCGETSEEIINHADNMMYDVKKSGKNAYQFFRGGEVKNH